MAANHLGGTSLAAAFWDDATGFADNAVLYIDNSSAQITGGLDTTGSTTNGIDALIVGRGFRGTIGTSSTDAQIEFDGTFTSPATVQLDYSASSGSFYLDCATTLASARVSGAGHLFLNDGTTTTLYVYSGKVTIAASATVTNIVIFGGVVTAEDGTDFTTVNIFGGRLESERGAGTITNGGGVLRLADQSGTTTTINAEGGTTELVSGAVTTINQYAGTVNESTAVEPITVTTYNLYGGREIKNPGYVTRTNDNTPSGGIPEVINFSQAPGL